MVKPANSQAQAAIAKPATAARTAMGHVLQHLPAALTAPCPERQAGGPEAANSRAPQGRGQGMGSMPMSTPARPVPHALSAVAQATAQGIVTRTGQDLQGLGGEAIEPGPAGMRPAACWGACGVCDCAADAGALARRRSAGAGAGAAGAQAIPDGNHGDNNLTTVGDRS